MEYADVHVGQTYTLDTIPVRVLGKRLTTSLGTGQQVGIITVEDLRTAAVYYVPPTRLWPQPSEPRAPLP